jgi:hypothetical protein
MSTFCHEFAAMRLVLQPPAELNFHDFEYDIEFAVFCFALSPNALSAVLG